MRFPSIKTVRKALVIIHRNMRKTPRQDYLDRGCDYAALDVRLQVISDGWVIQTGDSSYDSDHRGYWGSSCITWERENLEDVARSLVEQAKCHMAECAC